MKVKKKKLIKELTTQIFNLNQNIEKLNRQMVTNDEPSFERKDKRTLKELVKLVNEGKINPHSI